MSTLMKIGRIWYSKPGESREVPESPSFFNKIMKFWQKSMNIILFLTQTTSDKSQLWFLPGTKRAALYLTMSREGEGIFYRSAHNLVNFWARSPKFCKVVTLDWVLKYRLLKGVRCGGFRGVRGWSNTKVAKLYLKVLWVLVPNCI